MYALGLLKEQIPAIQKIPISERLPSKFLSFFDCSIPTPKSNEVLVKIRGAGLNFNSVWQSICHPASPDSLIDAHVRRNPGDSHHRQDYYIFGSDGAGIVSAVGDEVRNFKVGDEVVIHCNVTNGAEHIDQMRDSTQSIWGYETNFGSFAEYTCVKEFQLLPKPKHLSWSQAGSYMLTLATAYRMLMSDNGASIKKGESCLIWGASGGLGAYAIQLCNLIGAIPIAVVSSDEKEIYCNSLGCERVVNLSKLGLKNFVLENGEPNYLMWQKLKVKINSLHKPGVDVVFEHIGRETLGASIYVLRRGGRVVTCAASSGFQCNIDLRYLWMEVKKIIGSHFANFDESIKANELMINGEIKCTTDTIITFKDIPDYLDRMYLRRIIGGKIGVGFP